MDLLRNLLKICHFFVIIYRELAQKILKLYVFAESNVAWIEFKLDSVLGKITGKIQHLKIKFFHHIISQIKDPLLESKWSILIVKMIFLIVGFFSMVKCNEIVIL